MAGVIGAFGLFIVIKARKTSAKEINIKTHWVLEQIRFLWAVCVIRNTLATSSLIISGYQTK